MSISSAANSPPLIVAHRGVSEDFPENTSAAFAAAIDSRADAIECDLQLTTDGQIVVCHDFGLQRYGHPDVIVSETSLQDLQRLDIGSWFAPQFSAERLLSLEQMLQNHGHRMPLWLEVKVPSGGESRIDHFCRKLVQTLAEYDLQHRVTVLSFDRSVLRRVSELDSEIELTLNTHQPQALTAADQAEKLAAMEP